MITILEYAELSAHVYNPENKISGSIKIKTTTAADFIQDSKDKNDGPWFRMKDVDETMSVTNHFYAQLYIKFDYGFATNAVIAVRGTVFKDYDNLLVDALAWTLDELGDGTHIMPPLYYLNLLLNFALKAGVYIEHHFPYIPRLKFTGHSLGGALAQLMPLKMGFLCETVAFNSPGVGHFEGVTKTYERWVMNVNSRNGIINKIGERVGDLKDIRVMESGLEACQFLENTEKNSNKLAHQYSQMAHLYGKTEIVKLVRSYHGIALVMLLAELALDGADIVYHLNARYAAYKSLAQPLPHYTPAINSDKLTTSLKIAAYIAKKHFTPEELSTKKWNIGSKIVDIIKDQHSIDNMVTALRREENSPVAHSFI